jgi:hypothetical protein
MVYFQDLHAAWYEEIIAKIVLPKMTPIERLPQKVLKWSIDENPIIYACVASPTSIHFQSPLTTKGT